MVDIIEIEASTHTIFMLEELLRYVKEDKEENDQATL